jgi:hypothetical protein
MNKDRTMSELTEHSLSYVPFRPLRDLNQQVDPINQGLFNQILGLHHLFSPPRLV